MSKKYELLFILPGTLAETEVPTAVEKVKEAVEKGGGKEVKVQDMGKSRIAYPIKHIRYGYFQLCHFEAEASEVKAIRENLGLMRELLRTVIRVAGTGEAKFEKLSAISDVTIRDHEPAKTAQKDKDREVSQPKEHIEASHQMDSKKTVKAETAQKEKTETKAENIKMEDIDKKLDELLDSNIADV